MTFLEAWKNAIKVQPEHLCLFSESEELDSAGIDAATNKNDLRPNLKMIERNLGHISDGEGLYLIALYSFFNDIDADKLLKNTIHESMNPCKLAYKLDKRRRIALANLILTYEGW